MSLDPFIFLSVYLQFNIHKVLNLPRNLHFKVHKVLRLPPNLHSKAHKVLHLPPTLHFHTKNSCDCHEICTPRPQSPAPATKSAHKVLQVHKKVLRLPRNLHSKAHKALRLPLATNSVCTSTSTKSCTCHETPRLPLRYCSYYSPVATLTATAIWNVFSQKHLQCLGSRLVASAAEERDKACVVGDGRWMWRWTGLGRDDGGSETAGAWLGTGLGREDGGERDGGGGRWRGARREVHGWGRGWGGKMELVVQPSPSSLHLPAPAPSPAMRLPSRSPPSSLAPNPVPTHAPPVSLTSRLAPLHLPSPAPSPSMRLPSRSPSLQAAPGQCTSRTKHGWG